MLPYGPVLLVAAFSVVAPPGAAGFVSVSVDGGETGAADSSAFPPPCADALSESLSQSLSLSLSLSLLLSLSLSLLLLSLSLFGRGRHQQQDKARHKSINGRVGSGT